MPSVFLYLGIMLGSILVWFSLLKRPIYEAVLISFLILLTVSGTWGDVGSLHRKTLDRSLRGRSAGMYAGTPCGTA